MPRQNRRLRDSRTAAVPVGAGERRDEWRGETYAVRSITAMAATKPYRCPGCDQLIVAGTPHVVAWRADDLEAGDRRHWHTPCWTARHNRRPAR